MSSVVVSIPGDRIEWGPVQPLAGEQGACVQAATVMVEDKPVLVLSLCWLTPQPNVPVVCNVNGRHAGPRD